MRARTAAAATAAALPLALLGAAAPATAATGTATVSVLHGVPDLPVDVYANGEELIADFTPGTLTDPLQLPAGSYDLAVYPAGSDPSSTQPAIEAKGVAVPAGANATVVAHLDAGGNPVLTPYVNDTKAVPAGQAGLTVRHDAAAPAVDVRADGTAVLTGLTNPGEASVTVPAGTVSADVTLAGTGTVAIGPTDLDLPEGTRTIVYAYGSAEAGNLALAVQSVSDLGSAPGSVPSGLVGSADDAAPVGVLAAGGAALVGAAFLALRSRRRAGAAS